MMPEQTHDDAVTLPRFERRALEASSAVRTPARIATLMLNVGLRCDSACSHCHHSCSPRRSETMSRETMLEAIELARRIKPDLVDITGGEPELFVHLPELVARLSKAETAVRVRTNLVALARAGSENLFDLFARHRVRVLASLPGTTRASLADQRDAAQWDTMLSVLRRLNARGYAAGRPADRSVHAGAGFSDGSLTLDIAYNPPFGEVPRPQRVLEDEFRAALRPLGVTFDSLFAIGNVPVGRFRDRLAQDGRYDEYLRRLAAAFNPDVVESLACRHGVEIAWDGTIWDCDFNLAARTSPHAGPGRVTELICADDPTALLAERRIGFGPHCYACAAASGTS